MESNTLTSALMPHATRVQNGGPSATSSVVGNQKWDILICEKILDRKRYWRRILLVGAVRLQVTDLALLEWVRSAVKAVAAVTQGGRS